MHYLLLQIRDLDDPMKAQEVHCFAEALDVAPARIRVWSLLQGPPDWRAVQESRAVLLGGAGRYSVVQGGAWLPPVLGFLARLVERRWPTFASCWGFQAMALALGGDVVTDLKQAELGTVPLRLTEAGREDPVFGELPDEFLAAMGHQDIVVALPRGVHRLASSERVANQAFRVDDAPIYATQFHPELTLTGFLDRLRTYPEYVEKIARVSVPEFEASCRETPEANQMLRRFAAQL